MTNYMLQSGNLNAGTTLAVTTSSLPGGSLVLVPFSPPIRHLPLTEAKSDAGIALTGTATGGTFGVSRTAGTSLYLIGQSTSASAVTDKAMWEIDLPDTWNPGSVIPVVVNFSIGGTGTLSGTATVASLGAYIENQGTETAITVTGGTQDIAATAADYWWTLAATGLNPGQRIVVEPTLTVTSSAGVNTGQLNRIGVQA